MSGMRAPAVALLSLQREVTLMPGLPLATALKGKWAHPKGVVQSNAENGTHRKSTRLRAYWALVYPHETQQRKEG
jgi:hypothetical protein